MTIGIQTLPMEVVNLIAAGEVIDSLAAVVRELAENALDAGATRIAVSLWSDQWRVRVADNGSGMALDDLQQAASAHSTSKIRSSDDLWKITSLGFRGEALHSLAALADLEILSRLTGTVEGWRVVYNSQGESMQVETVAIAPGTVVTVSNLFGTWPVRRKGLPSVPQQLKAVQSTIYQIALCHPHVTWQVQQNERPWFTISPGTTAQQILPQILKQIRQTDLQQLTLEVPTPSGARDWGLGTREEKGCRDLGLGTRGNSSSLMNGERIESNSISLQLRRPTPSKIQLVLGLPDRCHRRRPDWVKVATNRRMVRSPELEQTILSAFARTCPRDRYPVCFVHLQISPSSIDWNRHAAKVEIYLHDPSFWQAQVSAAIARALHLNDEVLPAAPIPDRVGQLLKASEQKSAYSVGISARQNDDRSSEAKGNKIGLMELRAIADR